MRKRGASIRDIESRLDIPRSTLSYWLRVVPISNHHKESLKRRADQALVKARKEAVKWHNAQKAMRMKLAEDDAWRTLERIDCLNNDILELALSLLYLGEGAKKSTVTAMGNSDPLVLHFFVQSLHRLYGIPLTDMKCELHLRADQNAKKMTRFWSRTLGIPSANFRKASFDSRTAGRTTYPDYKGVCIVNCSRVAIERKLVYIATTFCSKIAEGVGG